MNETADTPAPLFEIRHGDAVIRITDDWTGHVLIEQIYEGLRQARRLRDDGRSLLAPPAPDSEAANEIIEAAELHGFQRIESGETYRATAAQIVALVTTLQGRQSKSYRSDG